jgi:quercetin dioxygenase-like cupin family protein
VIDVHPTVSEDCMFSVHEGEEFIYVLKGKIQISYGPDVYILSPGDSIYYDSTTPHEVRAAGEENGRIIAVIYTPE